MTHLDELVSFILSDELKEVRNYNCYDRLVAEAKRLQQKQVKNIAYEPVLATVFTESVKANMASEWSKSRSEGDRQQDRDCYYDYLMGIEAAIRKMQNGG